MSAALPRGLVSRRAINVGYVEADPIKTNHRSTVRHAASGVPVVPALNLSAKAPHDHHHHDGAGPRTDIEKLPSWTSKSLLRGHTVFSRTAVNSMYMKKKNGDH